MNAAKSQITASGTDAGAARKLIMATAAQLFAEKGYGAVGVAELGDAAGYGKGALYYHIGSKEALLFDIMTTYMVELNARAEEIVNSAPSVIGCIEALSLSFMKIMSDNRAEMTVCFREVHALGVDNRQHVMALHRRYQDIWSAVFSRAHVEGGVEISRTEAKALLGMYFYSFLWVRANHPSDLMKIADTFSRIVLKALGMAGQ